MVTTGTDEHAIAGGGTARGSGSGATIGSTANTGSGTPASTRRRAGRGQRPADGSWRLPSRFRRTGVAVVAAGGNIQRSRRALRAARRRSRRRQFGGPLTRAFFLDRRAHREADYDSSYRKVPLQFEETRDTVGVDAQQRMPLADRHDFVFGGDARISHGDDKGIAGFFFDPQERTNQVYSAFVQDEIALRPSRLYLILGTKLESNDYTGVEVQPTARMRWMRTPQPDALGRRLARGAPPNPLRHRPSYRQSRHPSGGDSGSEDFKAESVVAYEAGYRIRPHSRVAIDVAAFANRYDQLRSQELPTAPGQPVTLRNLLNARTSGVEVSATFQPSRRWRLHGSVRLSIRGLLRRSGQHRSLRRHVRSQRPVAHASRCARTLDLPRGFALDGTFPARQPTAEPARAGLRRARSASRLDGAARLGECRSVGQNLLHDTALRVRVARRARYDFERARLPAVDMAVLVTAASLTVAAVVAGVDHSRRAQSGETLENDVKAAFLYNFTKFIEWPAAAFQDPRTVPPVRGGATRVRARRREPDQRRELPGPAARAGRRPSPTKPIAATCSSPELEASRSTPRAGARRTAGTDGAATAAVRSGRRDPVRAGEQPRPVRRQRAAISTPA